MAAIGVRSQSWCQEPYWVHINWQEIKGRACLSYHNPLSCWCCLQVFIANLFRRLFGAPSSCCCSFLAESALDRLRENPFPFHSLPENPAKTFLSSKRGRWDTLHTRKHGLSCSALREGTHTNFRLFGNFPLNCSKLSSNPIILTSLWEKNHFLFAVINEVREYCRGEQQVVATTATTTKQIRKKGFKISEARNRKDRK